MLFRSSLPALLLLLLIALLLVAACDSTGPDEPIVEECVASIPNVLQPLSTEYSWEYLIYEELGTGLDEQPDTLHVEYSEMRDIPIAEGLDQAYQAELTSNRPTPSTKTIWSNGPNGWYVLGLTTPEDTLLSIRLVYPYPGQVGATTQFLIHARDPNGYFFVENSSDIRLISVDEELETPAGIFSICVYRYYQPPPADDML